MRQARKTAATWVIAGKGVLPELQTDWLFHRLYAEDPSHVSAEKYDHGEEESADDVQNPAEVAGAGEPKIDTNHEPAAVPFPQKKVDPGLQEALLLGASVFFKVKKINHGDFYPAWKTAADAAASCYTDLKGLDPNINTSVFTAKWRKMGWWPQPMTSIKEKVDFFRTIAERLERGENLKYDPAKKDPRRRRPASHAPERTQEAAVHRDEIPNSQGAANQEGIT